MDGAAFDRLSRAVGRTRTRRSLLGTLVGMAGLTWHSAGAKRKHKRKRKPCGGAITCADGSCLEPGKCCPDERDCGTYCIAGTKCCNDEQRCENGSCAKKTTCCPGWTPCPIADDCCHELAGEVCAEEEGCCDVLADRELCDGKWCCTSDEHCVPGVGCRKNAPCGADRFVCGQGGTIYRCCPDGALCCLGETDGECCDPAFSKCCPGRRSCWGLDIPCP